MQNRAKKTTYPHLMQSGANSSPNKDIIFACEMT